jgi:hypothetical protein
MHRKNFSYCFISMLYLYYDKFHIQRVICGHGKCWQLIFTNSQPAYRWCNPPAWQCPTVHNAAGLVCICCRSLVRKQQTITHTVHIWQPAIFICFTPWSSTCEDIVSPVTQCQMSYHYVADATATFDLDKLVTCCCDK